MPADSSPLEEAFIEDHRHLTQGFSRLLQALEDDDLPAAVQLAAQLDRQAGAHIEFEESVLYPEVARCRGRESAERLYREHQIALAGVKFLLDCKDAAGLKPEDRVRLLEQVQIALDHAIGCGALLSHLTVLDAAQQARLLEQLQVFRRRGRRWSELPKHRPEDAKNA